MQPRVTLIALTTPLLPDLTSPEDIIEYSGRWDYGPKSIAKMGDSAIIGRWIAAGEESMLEMVDVVFLIECSRVVSHELVRHRIASYQQESQRYVKYDDEDPIDLTYLPPEVSAAGEDALVAYRSAMVGAHAAYLELKRLGVKSQIARYVLPNATRTRIIAKMNLREWRHVLRLRCHTSAQPEMRSIMMEVLETLESRFPTIFADVRAQVDANQRSSR